MAVPIKIADLNTTESSNSPSGSESVGVNLDNYLRAAFAILKQTQSKGSDIASGSTIAIPDNGNYFVITGTTTIGAINDSFNGRVSILKFNDIVTLTNSAGLLLFGGDLTTAAGDILTVVNESAGVYRAIGYIDASKASDYIVIDSTDTLTNKTIVAANNTITTAASGDLVATELDAALAELESEITALDSAKAPLASPALTGTPTAPTAAPATGGTQIATNAYADASTPGENTVGETQLDIDALQVVGVLPTAWCVFDGTTTDTNAPTSGYNVTSITRLSVGYYQILFTVAMDITGYSMVGSAGRGTTLSELILAPVEHNLTTVALSTNDNASTLTDADLVSIHIFGGKT